jgi:hypothetical protein
MRAFALAVVLSACGGPRVAPSPATPSHVVAQPADDTGERPPLPAASAELDLPASWTGTAQSATKPYGSERAIISVDETSNDEIARTSETCDQDGMQRMQNLNKHAPRLASLGMPMEMVERYTAELGTTAGLFSCTIILWRATSVDIDVTFTTPRKRPYHFPQTFIFACHGPRRDDFVADCLALRATIRLRPKQW